jgi:hypothetical protein
MTIYECGICGLYHKWEYRGDCRDNANRFVPDEYAIRLGIDEWELDIRSWEERVEADA